MPSIFLGIDVGGTATRWVAVDDEGAVVGSGKGRGGTGLMLTGGQAAQFEQLIRDLELPRPVVGVRAGVTGIGPALLHQATEIFARALDVDAALIALGDDMELSYLSVFAPGEGHLVSAGTGSIGLHVTATGETIRVGGRGMLIDDGGSGTWIALTALDRLYRLIDEAGGTPGADILRQRLDATIGAPGWEAARAFVYGSDRGRIGTLARAVAAAADAGDPLAESVIADAVAELARLALALETRAGRLPVAFIGGVLELSPSIRPALVGALPDRQVGFPQVDIALSAARMARRDAVTRRQRQAQRP